MITDGQRIAIELLKADLLKTDKRASELRFQLDQLEDVLAGCQIRAEELNKAIAILQGALND